MSLQLATYGQQLATAIVQAAPVEWNPAKHPLIDLLNAVDAQYGANARNFYRLADATAAYAEILTVQIGLDARGTVILGDAAAALARAGQVFTNGQATMRHLYQAHRVAAETGVRVPGRRAS